METTTKVKNEVRPLFKIASEISKDWSTINNFAIPYLDAMESLNKISDRYLYMSGENIVSNFLLNATCWKGDTAERIKTELRTMLD